MVYSIGRTVPIEVARCSVTECTNRATYSCCDVCGACFCEDHASELNTYGQGLGSFIPTVFQNESRPGTVYLCNGCLSSEWMLVEIYKEAESSLSLAGQHYARLQKAKYKRMFESNQEKAPNNG